MLGGGRGEDRRRREGSGKEEGAVRFQRDALIGLFGGWRLISCLLLLFFLFVDFCCCCFVLFCW